MNRVKTLCKSICEKVDVRNLHKIDFFVLKYTKENGFLFKKEF